MAHTQSTLKFLETTYIINCSFLLMATLMFKHQLGKYLIAWQTQ